MHATKLPPSASPMKGAGIHSILHLATSRWKVSFANRAVTTSWSEGKRQSTPSELDTRSPLQRSSWWCHELRADRVGNRLARNFANSSHCACIQRPSADGSNRR